MVKRRGLSYAKRVEEINRIYDFHARHGLSNREIWRRYVYPVYAMSERTFYNMLNASADIGNQIADDSRQLLLFKDSDFQDGRDEDDSAEHPAGYFRRTE